MLNTCLSHHFRLRLFEGNVGGRQLANCLKQLRVVILRSRTCAWLVHNKDGNRFEPDSFDISWYCALNGKNGKNERLCELQLLSRPSDWPYVPGRMALSCWANCRRTSFSQKGCRPNHPWNWWRHPHPLCPPEISENCISWQQSCFFSSFSFTFIHFVEEERGRASKDGIPLILLVAFSEIPLPSLLRRTAHGGILAVKCTISSQNP